MKTQIKLTKQLLKAMREDLQRPHPFAAERVGFITLGVASLPNGDLIVLARGYQAVEDADYIRDPRVGAMIGSDAMRKAIQKAYADKSALIHVHSHGGRGRPAFSRVDLSSGAQFVPGFFSALPRTPHGLMVLSNNSATALLWHGPKASPVYVDRITQIGASLFGSGERDV